MEAAGFLSYVAATLVVVGLLTAGTALALRRSLTRNTDVDSLFWFGFSGAAAIILAIVVSAATLPGSAGIVSAGALLCVGIAGGWLWRGERDRRARLVQDALRRERDLLRNRHESVLQEWVTYELDPAAAIDYPAMTDLSRADTSQLIRAMRSAALLKARCEADDDGWADYEAAIGRLETAFTAAEKSAGVVRGADQQSGVGSRPA